MIENNALPNNPSNVPPEKPVKGYELKPTDNIFPGKEVPKGTSRPESWANATDATEYVGYTKRGKDDLAE